MPKIVRAIETSKNGVDRVFAHLRALLMDGSIRAGDRLGSERDLATQIGVSRPVVREALRAMAMIGALEIRERVGTIVRRPDVSVLGDFFTFALAQQSDMVDDIMEARIAIECQSARLACERATVEDFERMRSALDRIEATIDNAEEGGRADFAFHSALVRAGRSETLNALYQAMAELLMRSHLKRRELVHVFASMKDYLVSDHKRIFDVIVARDAERADQVLRKHFAIGNDYRRQAAVGAPPRRVQPD